MEDIGNSLGAFIDSCPENFNGRQLEYVQTMVFLDVCRDTIKHLDLGKKKKVERVLRLV